MLSYRFTAQSNIEQFFAFFRYKGGASARKLLFYKVIYFFPGVLGDFFVLFLPRPRWINDGAPPPAYLFLSL